MKMKYVLTVAVALPLMGLVGCSGGSDSKIDVATSAPVTAEALPKMGTVKEVREGDGFSYILYDAQGQTFWVAGPKTMLNPGEQVAIKDPVQKTNYKSNDLGKTFDNIYFVSTVMARSAMMAGAGGMGGMPGAGGMGGMPGAMGGMPGGMPAMGANGELNHPKTAVAQIDIGKIEKAGNTVEDVFKKKGELAGKNVSIRGKVVKFSGGIMGTNWLHIKDGTGSAGTDDLTVTSKDSAQVGDVVVVNGVLSKDIDIGSGYKFEVIVQDAKLTK